MSRGTLVQLRPTVLIVDDHPAFRSLARALLESEGFAVVGEAEDGEAAIAAVAALRPAVVLLDVQLPGLDGFEVAERLAAQADAPAVVSFAVVATHVAAAGAWLGCVVAAVVVGERHRLAPYAAGAALLAIGTGVALAVGHVRSIHGLFETAYGLAVSTKLAVVALAMALAMAAKHRAELAAGLGVLAVAAVLVSLLPPL